MLAEPRELKEQFKIYSDRRQTQQQKGFSVRAAHRPERVAHEGALSNVLAGLKGGIQTLEQLSWAHKLIPRDEAMRSQHTGRRMIS